MKIHIEEDILSGQLKVYIVDDRNGERFIGTGITMEKMDRGLFYGPTFTLQNHHGEGLANLKTELIRLGQIDNADKATVDAMKYHLEDMRALVFKRDT